MSRKFVNLHNHTGVSVYDGLGTPKEHAEWMLKNAGEDSGALALTNHGSINDIGNQVEAQMKYEKDGTPCKMIYGVESYFVPSIAEWKKLKFETDEQRKEAKKSKSEVENSDLVIEDETESKKKSFNPLFKSNHLIVLAQNQKGLENLFTLVSRSYREGFYRKPRMDIEMLREHNEGLILSSACLHPDSIIKTSLGKLNIKKLISLLDEGKEIFALGFDVESKKICFRKIMWGAKTRKSTKLLKLTLKNGRTLKLTHDHKVYTERGWILAEDIKNSDKILSIPQGVGI